MLRRSAGALLDALRRASSAGAGPRTTPPGTHHPASSASWFSSSTPAPPTPPAAGDDEETLDQIRARIFGTHIGDGRPSGRKLLRSRLAGPTVVAWYPADIVDPLYVDVDDVR